MNTLIGKRNMNWINEIRDDIRKLPQSAKSLRTFGLVVGTAFLLIGLLAYLKGWSAGTEFVSGGAGILLIVLGLILPAALKRIHKVWMGFAIVLGSIVSRIILTILFFVIISPIAVIARMMGKKFIQQHRNPSGGSYWIRRDPARTMDYEKMS
jgi:hypothetical protein